MIRLECSFVRRLRRGAVFGGLRLLALWRSPEARRRQRDPAPLGRPKRFFFYFFLKVFKFFFNLRLFTFKLLSSLHFDDLFYMFII